MPRSRTKFVPLVGLFVLLIATASLADGIYQMTELEGAYPPARTQTITFPDDMTGVSHIVVTLTYTVTPGVISCGGGDPEPYNPGAFFYWEVEALGMLRTWSAGFPGTWAPGSPVTLTQLVNGADLGFLQGETVEIRASTGELSGDCEIIEPLACTFDSVEIRLIGNVVPAEGSSFSTIKGLFD